MRSSLKESGAGPAPLEGTSSPNPIDLKPKVLLFVAISLWILFRYVYKLLFTHCWQSSDYFQVKSLLAQAEEPTESLVAPAPSVDLLGLSSPTPAVQEATAPQTNSDILLDVFGPSKTASLIDTSGVTDFFNKLEATLVRH